MRLGKKQIDMDIQLYSPGSEEIVEVQIDDIKHPTVFEAIVNEKVTCTGMPRKMAEAQTLRWSMQCEIYYDPEVQCCFLVESCYLEDENNEVYSPYTGKLCKPYEE